MKKLVLACLVVVVVIGMNSWAPLLPEPALVHAMDRTDAIWPIMLERTVWGTVGLEETDQCVTATAPPDGIQFDVTGFVGYVELRSTLAYTSLKLSKEDTVPVEEGPHRVSTDSEYGIWKKLIWGRPYIHIGQGWVPVSDVIRWCEPIPLDLGLKLPDTPKP